MCTVLGKMHVLGGRNNAMAPPPRPQNTIDMNAMLQWWCTGAMMSRHVSTTTTML
jgi:hypothetical protein